MNILLVALQNSHTLCSLRGSDRSGGAEERDRGAEGESAGGRESKGFVRDAARKPQVRRHGHLSVDTRGLHSNTYTVKYIPIHSMPNTVCQKYQDAKLHLGTNLEYARQHVILAILTHNPLQWKICRTHKRAHTDDWLHCKSHTSLIT